MYRLFWIFFLSLVATAPVYSLEPMPVNQPGDIGVSVFVTDSPEFIKEWVQTPSSHSPIIKRISEANFNQMVHAGFAITGFSKDSNSRVNFVVDIKITAPNGSILLQKDKWAAHSKQIIIDKGIILADPVLDMMFERTDPPGKYIISATVIDKLTGKKAQNSTVLSIK